MIEARALTKRFGKKTALDGVSCKIEDGSIFGMVGSNGSGKSTLLRTIAGIYYPDAGELLMDGEPVFENIQIKDQLFFVSDFPYFFRQATILDMIKLYQGVYSNWDDQRFQQMCAMFPLDIRMKVVNMSKGMQRQAALMLALSTRPQVLLLDEVFDGLDPVIRQMLKRLLFQEVQERGATIVVASHNLRELEDLCDHVGLLHKGRVLFARELDDLKLGVHKVQAAYSSPLPPDAMQGLNVIKQEMRGSLYSFVIRGKKEEILQRLNQRNPLFIEALPLTLEEVFISEMEVVGYDVNSIV